MVSWRNAADGRPVARPEGAPQAARLGVTALGKGTTLACAPCLDPSSLWGSACGFIYEGMSHWDYRLDTGISEYNNSELLHKFTSWIEDGQVWVDADEIAAWEQANPQPYNRSAYQGLYADIHGTPEEPYTAYIHELAAHGLERVGQHGKVAAMGVPRQELPMWEDIQFVTAQLHRLPQLGGVPVGHDLVIGPGAKKPLKLDIPLFVSDMSFGALSGEAKVALAKGAELAGTGICSGEGGMLPEEQAENSRYFYELASARFGFSMDKLKRVQAFHFKGGQGAKTGTGGHLPGCKVKGRIAEVRGLKEGEAAVSPSRFPDWDTLDAYRDFATEVREETGGIPVGVKLSAQHIEKDMDAAFEIGVDYIILDGRGGGTGAAPVIFRDNISVPTIPALARARRHLDMSGQSDVTLMVTGGLRTPADFAKALALGADGIAVSNAAIQAIGCLALPFTHKSCHRALAHGSDQGAVRSQWLFHWQAPQRRYGPCARVPCGRAVRRPSAALRSLAMEQPLPRERALHMTTGRLAVARLMCKGQG